MSRAVAPHLYDSIRADRLEALLMFGFTERQARFLLHVLVHSGVFLERQYCQFAGIAHGQKTHDFLRRLVDRKFVRVITPGKLHTGRLFHLQYKPLYEAIGEPDNRNRKLASLGRMVERLMLLDVVLRDRDHTWLGTENDKLDYFRACRLAEGRFSEEFYPRLVVGDGTQKTVRYFPDKQPIGIERAGSRDRHVFVYLVRQNLPRDFRLFLVRHTPVLAAVHFWTIRLIVPRRFRKAVALYRWAVRDYLIALLGGEAGLRCGEMMALESTDVDMNTRQLCVARSEWKGHITPPKGGRLRYVPLTKRLTEALRQARHLRGVRVLCDKRGQPLK
jgi:hypothetical protein